MEEKIVLYCSKCHLGLRVPLLADKVLLVRCPRGCVTQKFDAGAYLRKQARSQVLKLEGLAVLVVLGVSASLLVWPRLAQQRSEYSRDIQDRKERLENELSDLRVEREAELAAIDPANLQLAADKKYQEIWSARSSFDSRFALTPREKAQLELAALSKDRTKSVEDIVQVIAMKASPRGSEVRVAQLKNGLHLDIDFDMSALDSSEKGARTTHRTLDDLKKEVRRLIHKVMFDVWTFCKDINLEKITIGCKHGVQQYETTSLGTRYTGEDNVVIYKIELEQKNMSELSDNPFLKSYSTERDTKVIFDHFPTLSLTDAS